jgi:hypothetical protein
MTGAFHLDGHVDPTGSETQRFELLFEERADLPNAREVFGRALDVDSLREQRDGLSLMRVDVVDELLFFRGDLLGGSERRKQNHEHERGYENFAELGGYKHFVPPGPGSSRDSRLAAVFLIESVEFPTKSLEFPMESTEFPMESTEFSLESSKFPMESSKFLKESSEFLKESAAFPKESMQLPSQSALILSLAGRIFYSQPAVFQPLLEISRAN